MKIVNKVLHKNCGGEIHLYKKGEEVAICDKCNKEILNVEELLSESIMKEDDSEFVGISMVKENQ